MTKGRIPGILMLLAAWIFQGCIHEYPVNVSGGGHQTGNDPTALDVEIGVDFDLSWQNMLHKVDFTTRDRTDNPHRFIIEISEQGESIARDEIYVSQSDFSLGSLRHKFSRSLSKKEYDVAVWYDSSDEDGEFLFDVSDMRKIGLLHFNTGEAKEFNCAHIADRLDLRNVSTDETFVYNLSELEHAGARFEIIATDVQQFISNQKEALLQGDSFRVSLNFSSGAYSMFDPYLGRGTNSEGSADYSGRMRLPFDEYDELKIAEGFLFCNLEDDACVQLTIKNSSLTVVSQTSYFLFPVKRGYITRVCGDFLTNPIDGVFSVNNIWEDDIEMEI